MTSKIVLVLVFILASCSTKKILFFYYVDNSNLKGKVKSVGEKGFKAIYSNSGIIAGVREREFDFEDDTQKFYDSLGHLSYEIYSKPNDSVHFEISYNYFKGDTIFHYRKYKQEDTFSLYKKQYFRDKYLMTEFLEQFGYKTYLWKYKYNRKGKIKISYIYENNAQSKEINLDSKRIVRYKQV